jgi:hypothetical protein
VEDRAGDPFFDKKDEADIKREVKKFGGKEKGALRSNQRFGYS